MSLPNEPARLDRIARAIALVQGDRAQQVHPQYTLDALEDLGATCRWSGHRWQLFYCGVSATAPTWEPRKLLDAWETNAAKHFHTRPAREIADA